MGGARAAYPLAPDCGDQLQGWLSVGGQRALLGDPGFSGIHGFEHPPPLGARTPHHAAVNEEKQDGHATRQGRLGPVFGQRKVVLEVKACITESLFNEGLDVLVIAVMSIGGQALDPLAREVSNG